MTFADPGPGYTWFQVLATALGSGLTLKLVEIVYGEFRKKKDTSTTVKAFVDQNLDPILKSVDDLVGRLCFAAHRDFKDLQVSAVVGSGEIPDSRDYWGLVYMFCLYWAKVELLRHQSLFCRLSLDPRGKELLQFINCLESRGVSLVGRADQRGIAESMFRRGPSGGECITFPAFVQRVHADADFLRWVQPIASILTRTRHTTERQRLLLYGCVLHSLVDHLDPAHEVGRDRPAYANKLTRRTRRDLQYRVFQQYLPFVKDTGKYLWPTAHWSPAGQSDSRKSRRPARL